MKASNVFMALQAAWGRGNQKSKYDGSTLPDWLWTDGPVVAGWEYNRFSKVFYVHVFHRGLHQEIESHRLRDATESSKSDL